MRSEGRLAHSRIAEYTELGAFLPEALHDQIWTRAAVVEHPRRGHVRDHARPPTRAQVVRVD